jgi:hypothetical protein
MKRTMTIISRQDDDDDDDEYDYHHRHGRGSRLFRVDESRLENCTANDMLETAVDRSPPLEEQQQRLHHTEWRRLSSGPETVVAVSVFSLPEQTAIEDTLGSMMTSLE